MCYKSIIILIFFKKYTKKSILIIFFLFLKHILKQSVPMGIIKICANRIWVWKCEGKSHPMVVLSVDLFYLKFKI